MLFIPKIQPKCADWQVRRYLPADPNGEFRYFAIHRFEAIHEEENPEYIQESWQ
jgi:hypothetical protein